MAACEHGADYESCPKGMTKAQMRDFAKTSTKGLPEHVDQHKAHANRNAAKR
jgi:hypothetical protein